MLARKEVVDLIKRPKVPKEGSEVVFDLNVMKSSYVLKDRSDDKIEFMLDVNQSRNVTLKLTCHHRNNVNIGLIRVDYNGTKHSNPEIITSKVPEILHAYAGERIQARTAHTHIYVEGYGLKWAMQWKTFQN
jgi:hypothetical protein